MDKFFGWLFGNKRPTATNQDVANTAPLTEQQIVPPCEVWLAAVVDEE